MKKLLYLLLLAAILSGCGNKEEAIKTATDWAYDYVLKFYTNPRIKNTTYKYWKYDYDDLSKRIVKYETSKCELEQKYWKHIDYSDKEKFSRLLLKNTFWPSEKHAYNFLHITESDYISVNIDFSYDIENDERENESFTVIMAAKTMTVLNAKIKREEKTIGEENYYLYTTL
jgi:hypothetical protein